MSRLPLIALLAAGALTLSPVPARAQLAIQPDLRAGARVRVSAPLARQETGRVLGYRGDTLLMLTGRADTVALSLSRASSVEVSTGISTSRRYGAMLGSAPGGLIGGALGAAVALSRGDPAMRSYATPLGMAAGAVLGMVAGAIFNPNRAEGWRRVGSGREVMSARVDPLVDRSGVGLSLTLGPGDR